MTDFNFSAAHKEAEKKYNLGKGEYFKPKEGQNKLRLVSECLEHPGTYKGKPTFKWLCQVIDTNDGQVKPYFMPDTVYKGIEALQLSDDFSFNSVPMPYEITISAKNAGTKEVIYNVLPGQLKELTKDEEKAIEEAPSIQDLQKKIRDNDSNKEETKEETNEKSVIDVDSVPF